MKLEEKIENGINAKVEELGFEIEYVEFVKEGNQNIARIVIDKENATVTIDDCELVSRAIEDMVDSMIDKEYILEVSSPGIEREIKNMKLYTKYIGSQIHIKLFKKIEQGKEFEGILESADQEKQTIEIKINDQIINLNIADIASAHTVYDFSVELGNGKNQNLNQIKKF